MNIGKKIRLNRIFSHPSGRLCSVAVDHFVGYQQQGMPEGLNDMPAMLEKIVSAQPGAVTMNKGIALSSWEKVAGKVPLIIQAGWFTPDDSVMETVATPAEAVRLGADAYAFSIGVRGPNEGKYFKMLCNAVEAAAPFDLPVIAHIYPRNFATTPPQVLHDPENIAWAVRAGLECGADVIKVGYTGDPVSFAQLVRQTPVPIVAAGGPKTNTFLEALESMAAACKAGGRGATIGRNIWGHPNPKRALEAFKKVILEDQDPAAVVKELGV